MSCANENFETPYDQGHDTTTPNTTQLSLCALGKHLAHACFSPAACSASTQERRRSTPALFGCLQLIHILLILQQSTCGDSHCNQPIPSSRKLHRTTTTTDLPVTYVDLLQKMQAFTNCMQIMPLISTTFTALTAVATRLRILQHN